MCTLIIGREVLGPGTTILAANRDEDPARPSDPPHVLAREPLLVGGSDRVAHGTWLAVRERRAAVAMLNRRLPDSALAPPERSRGMLALDVAAAAPDAADDMALGHAARAAALAAISAARYAPFSLVFATRGEAWVLSWDGASAITDVPTGWHVLTHSDLDDPDEPRTARLLRELEGFAPSSWDEARRALVARLAEHDPPAVCIHDGRMATVSYALVLLAGDRSRYLHADGRPCEAAPLEFTGLLDKSVTRS